MLDVSMIALGIGLGMGIAAIGAGLGLGWAASSGLAGMSRQPEAANKIQIAMLLALAFIELVFLLTFVVLNGLSTKLPNYEEARKQDKLVAPISASQGSR